jgi:hypothetical protein
MPISKIKTSSILADAASTNLNIDAGTLFLDAANNRVGISTTTPTVKLHVTTAAAAALPATTGTTLATSTLIRLGTSSDSAGGIGTIGLSTNQMWLQATDSTNLATSYALLLNPNGGNVGIGTTSPSTTLEVSKSANGEYGIIIRNATSGTVAGALLKFIAGTDVGQIIRFPAGHSAKANELFITNVGATSPITFATQDTERMRIDSAGNLSVAGTVIVNSRGNATAIVNGAANAVGNIGSSSTFFNRLFAQATTALYADLAEMYTTDAEYAPGTVLVFGGNQEVTISTVTHDNRVAGVVSTNPAHVMNSGLQGEFTVAVALTGRVPVSVIGNISAGDRVVTSNRAGVAEALDMSRYQPGVIIGKALQGYSGNGVGVIEVVVGRL